MGKMLKNAAVLCIITLIAGLALGGIYELTKEVREEKKQEKKVKAYQMVYEEAKSFDKIEVETAALKEYLIGNGIDEKKAVIDEVVAAKTDSGEQLGYVITVTEKEGYNGDITFTVSISLNGTLLKISILSINETVGLGMEAAEEKFLTQFSNKKADTFSYTKTGSKEDNEIDAVSGATVTTNAMVTGVNAALSCYRFLTGESGVSHE